jgi:hypothetical protein
MPYPTPQNDVQIDSAHTGAVCKEMGERLSIALGPQSIELQPRLLSLMKQLAEQGLKIEHRLEPIRLEPSEMLAEAVRDTQPEPELLERSFPNRGNKAARHLFFAFSRASIRWQVANRNLVQSRYCDRRDLVHGRR